MDKIESLLREFAGQIGSTTRELWPLAVQHYAWSAWAKLIAVLFALIAGLIIIVVYRQLPGKPFEDAEPNVKGFVLVAGCLILLAACIAAPVNLANNLPNAMAPEGGLLREIFSRLK